MLEFCPSCIESIHNFSCFIELQGSAVKPGTIARDGGILKRGLSVVNLLFSVGDALFHALEFASLFVGEFLFRCS